MSCLAFNLIERGSTCTRVCACGFVCAYVCVCLCARASPPPPPSSQLPPTDPLYSPALSLAPLSLCPCEDVGFIPAIPLLLSSQWLYHRGEECCFTEERKWGVWLCPAGSQRWAMHIQIHASAIHKVFKVCECFGLRSSLLIWVTDYGSVSIVTVWVNNTTSFGQHSVCVLSCTQVSGYVFVRMHVAPLVVSSLAELSSSCPICSLHMALSFSRETLYTLSLLLSPLCLFLFLFLFALLHLLHILPVHYPLKILSYLLHFNRNRLSTHLHHRKFVLLTHVPAPSLLGMVTMVTPFRHLAGSLSVLYCSITHHRGSWLARLSLSVGLLLLTTLKHTHCSSLSGPLRALICQWFSWIHSNIKWSTWKPAHFTKYS